MGKLLIGDFLMKNNKVYFIITFILLLFSYYEINGNIRVGGLIRDTLSFSSNNNNNIYTFINKSYKEENIELKNMLKINYSLIDFDIINASVIERDKTYWLDEITINKGSRDGIENNQIVVVNDGMIGKVLDSSFKTSKVKLITGFSDPISVTINNINKLLTVNNYSLYIRGINDNDNISVGDKVITSGLSDIFPKGILIGEIKEIKKEKNDVGYYALVGISSNINNTKYVTVLKRKDK